MINKKGYKHKIFYLLVLLFILSIIFVDYIRNVIFENININGIKTQLFFELLAIYLLIFSVFLFLALLGLNKHLLKKYKNQIKNVNELMVVESKAGRKEDGSYDLNNITNKDEISNLNKLLALEKEKSEKEIRLREKLENDLMYCKKQLNLQTTELEKFKLGVENASDHIVITDSEGKIIFANTAAEKITGYSKEEMFRKKVGGKDLWGGLMDLQFYENLWHTIKVEKKSFHGEIKNKKKDGQNYIAQVTISPVLNQEGEIKYFIGIERDITQIKKVDQAKTEFVSLASHQLRTPLSSINWYLEMLISGDAGELNEQQKKFLLEALKSSKKMVELVNALLNVSRIELGTFVVEPSLQNIIYLTEEALKELEIEINIKKIKIVKEYDNEITEINLDKNLVTIILQNILSNSIKYTPENGTVKIKIYKIVEDLRIEISDSGIGIPDNQKDKVFSKLFRADNVKEKEIEGTGLGLYIVKSILDHSGGKIWFDSKENQGSTFFVEIPLSGMIKREGTKTLT